MVIIGAFAAGLVIGSLAAWSYLSGSLSSKDPKPAIVRVSWFPAIVRVSWFGKPALMTTTSLTESKYGNPVVLTYVSIQIEVDFRDG